MHNDGSPNEQESWNKRFEMSLAEIYMELPEGHRARADYEALIAEPRGKIVEMSMRLDTIEDSVRELQLKAAQFIQPQPPTEVKPQQPTLIEAVDSLVEFYKKYPRVCYDGERDLLDAMHSALDRAKKREELIERIKTAWDNAHVVTVCDLLGELNAFDRGEQ